ncbi:hypothetical protein AgCh_027775 [Apium graveolens]
MGSIQCVVQYRLLQAQKERWTTDDNNSLWRKMWQVKAPPKVLNLIWRALSYCLPTMVMLDKKRVPVVKTCPVCNGEDETILHTLVTCPFAHQCWQKVILDIQQKFDREFEGWLETVLCNMSNDRKVVVFTVCWAIWKARNDKHWNKKQVSLNGLLAPAKLYLSQWQEAQSRSTEALIYLDSSRSGVNTWVAPQMVTIKVNVDAATFRDPAAYGVGLIARDSKGELVHGHSSYYLGEISPETTEALAIEEALSWIMENQWGDVQLESDCLVAVQEVKSKIHMLSPFGSVVEECRILVSNSNNINLSFVRRSAYMAAHFLAKESCSYPGRVINRSDVPIGLKDVMMHDLKSCLLRRLRLVSCSRITEEGLNEMFRKLPLLEELHLCYIPISRQIIEVIGRCCLQLKSFSLNRQNFIWPHYEFNEEALAIAENLPGLRHLQLLGNGMTRPGLEAILDNCIQLESFDMRQCFNLAYIGDDLEKRLHQQIKNIRLPFDSAEDYGFSAAIYEISDEDYDFGSVTSGGSDRDSEYL